MKQILSLFLLFLLTFTAGCGGEQPETVSEAPAAEGQAERGHAAVAMPDTFAAQAANEILDAGGNAVDAAVAAGFSLAVTLPEAGNIGGGGFMLIWMDGEASFVDYREKAPLTADRDMFLDSEGNVIDGLSRTGHLSVGVPGTPAGLWEAHQRFGKLPWADVVEPSIRLARDGFEVPVNLGNNIEYGLRRFADKTNFADYFAEARAGELFVQPELAATLQRIADEGPDGFYAGETADLFVEEMLRGGGLITHEDLQAYEAIWREPLHTTWRQFDMYAAPPPSSGGFAVIQLLKIKDLLAHEFEGLEHNSPQYVHLVAEIEKRVFADRAEYLGDSDFVDVPIEELLTDEYLAMRAAEISVNDISDLGDVRPGLESMDTTHYSIVDHDGNAVSNTYTLNLGFGSGVIVEGAGFLLNDEMDDFSVKPGVPNAFGVVGSEANAIAPGKRMLSSMSPTILIEDGEIELVVGTPGGSTIFTSVFQTIVNIYDFGMTPLDAVGASRFHHQLLPPDEITYSPNVPLPEETISGLTDMGYRPVPHGYPFGDVQAILRAEESWDAASDPRKRGESRVIAPQEAAAQ
ncbi:MAG: gamma-glutamyltransferase [Woeseiaceae bacterium]|nr:gamma-glutamyltransferase [Woeseiaceae bacterium]